MAHTNCPHCRAFVPPPRSRLRGAAVLTLAYVVTFAFAFVFTCMGPLGLLLLPFFLPGAISGITCAHSYADAGEWCPRCGKVIEYTLIPRPEPPIGVAARA
jgi:hypothetical protein